MKDIHISTKDVLRSLDIVDDVYSGQLGITFASVSIIPIEREILGVEDFDKMLEAWAQWGEKVCRGKDITLTLIKDSYWIFRMWGIWDGAVGLAELGSIGDRGKAIVKFNTSFPRFTAFIIAHELGHVMGAPHTDEGLMKPAVDVLIPGEIRFSAKSIKEIEKHLATLD